MTSYADEWKSWKIMAVRFGQTLTLPIASWSCERISQSIYGKVSSRCPTLTAVDP
jgi:hypothetical protein